MDRLGQHRDNIFYLACAEHSARKRRRDPADDRCDRDLPPDNPKRWTARRKAAVILAIRNKVITVWDACERYDLSAEELIQWQRDRDRYGAPGLQITRISIHRKMSKPQ